MDSHGRPWACSTSLIESGMHQKKKCHVWQLKTIQSAAMMAKAEIVYPAAGAISESLRT
jgi:hypothetical protein